jgi:hypothetical protein
VLDAFAYEVYRTIDENKLRATSVVAVKCFPFRSARHGSIELVTGSADMEMSTIVCRSIIGAQRPAAGRDVAKNELAH